MSVFDKIKNLFYEVEEVEVPKPSVEEVKVKQELEVEKKDEMDDVVSERDLLKSETTFKFPVIFEDEDFKDMEKEKPHQKQYKNEAREIKNSSKYKKPTLDREVIREVIEKPKKFSPSPIISPVYGVLDKDTNKKLDSKSKSRFSEHSKDMVVNFDTIRQKAYGSLSDDIEKELNSNNSDIDEIEQEINGILEENNLLSDLEDSDDENTPEAVELENKNENNDEYNYADFGVEYKLDQSDDSKEKQNEDSQEQLKEQEVVQENNNELESNEEKDVELTEDLFNLIDSMYDR